MMLMQKEPTRQDDGARWRAVIARDAEADGRFVYAVRTTGVYCRPSCPSRTARRENVAYFASGADAARAGFRPCKRCRPDEASETERQAERIARACRFIASVEEPPTLATLAAQAGLSPHHFHRLFKAATGVTPKAYAAQRRADRLAEEVQQAPTITQAVYEAGFSGPSRFYAAAKGRLGMAPSDYRTGGRRQSIRYGVATCSLGFLLVAATDKGVCAILLGDDASALVAELEARFPAAERLASDDAFERVVAHVVAFVDQPAGTLDLPLDITGTAFQQRVWEALRRIPAGTTATYTEVAAAIGAPLAHRAVAGACAANPVAIAIPCHRVVRSDGGLSGYRWGPERKRHLIERERTAAKR